MMEKNNLTSSFAPLGNQVKEIMSPRIMSYIKTITYDYFNSNLANVQINLLAGGYGAAANIKLEMAADSLPIDKSLGGSNGHTLYLFSAPRSMDPYNIQNLDTS